MSNSRRAAHANRYRTGYLRSRQWFARRDRWFREHGSLRCAGCDREATRSQVELHHLSYEGVHYANGGWSAQEAHDDLWPMHPACHELLHRIIDKDPVLARHRNRQQASEAARRLIRIRFGVGGTHEQR